MNILIVGAGEIGFHLTRQLAAERHNIAIVESDPDKAHSAEEQLDALVVRGSGSSYRTLRQAGIEQTEVFAALTSSDEVNLLACRYAARLGIPHKIARVRRREFIEPGFPLTREELGVDQLIHPEKETADAIIRLIRQSSATDILEFSGGAIQLIGLRTEQGSPVLRQPLREIWLKFEGIDARIVAIVRRQQTLIPGGDDILTVGDQVFVMCRKEDAGAVVRIMGKANVSLHNIMILGGGLVGQMVAEALQRSHNLKLIESRAEKSVQIADDLEHTLVIHGDGTDMDLLALEGIADMDAFIAVTGDNEANIISTLMARHLKVPRTIALVNKTEYLPIMHTVGMDAVVSKKLLTVNAILRFIQKRALESIATIPGVAAEIVEISARHHSGITRRKLKNISFPRNAILGAVRRDGEVIIPTGDTQIRPGDRVVVFCTRKALDDVNRLF